MAAQATVDADLQPPALTETLLHGPPTTVERRPDSRWAYPLWGLLLLTLFLGYHSAMMLVLNLPSKGLIASFHKQFLDHGHGHDYFRLAQLHQSWAMFAPNPNRTNTFIRVFVEDQEGQLWDFEQDIWAEDRYPYLFYDRRGKVNRRLDGKKHYQRLYGAWVCREWERYHGGEAAKSVTFIKRWTRVPPPSEVIAKGGWDQWEAPYKQTEQETITCKTTANAQLPPYLRERYGLPPAEEDSFRSVRQQTWWDKAEAERKRLEREAEAEVRRAQMKTQREARRSRRPGGSAPLDERGPVAEPGRVPPVPAVPVEDDDGGAAEEVDY